MMRITTFCVVIVLLVVPQLTYGAPAASPPGNIAPAGGGITPVGGKEPAPDDECLFYVTGGGDPPDPNKHPGDEELYGISSGLGSTFEIVETSGWPILGRSDLHRPTGGWLTDPVVVDSGEYIMHQRDMSFPHHGTRFTVDRVYRHQLENLGGVTTDFGRHFHTNLRLFVDEVTAFAGNDAEFHLGNGEFIHYGFVGAGVWSYEVIWGHYRITKVSNQYSVTHKDGYTYYFQPSSDPANLVSTRNRFGEGEDYFYHCNYLTKVSIGGGNDVTIERDSDHTITRIRDYAGRTVDYAYDSDTNLTRVQDACGSCSTVPTAGYAYDSNHRITQVKDANDVVVRSIAYNGSNQMTRYYDAAGGTYHFAYSGTKLEIDPEGNTTEYYYGTAGRPTTKKFLMGAGGGDDITYNYGYDGFGRISSVALPNGTVAQLVVDGNHNVLSKLVTSGGNTITASRATYSSDFSQPEQRYAPTGEVTEYEYGASGERTLEIRPGALTRAYTYNGSGQQLTETDTASAVREYEYDSLGFVTKTTVDSGDLALETLVTRDSLGRAITTQSPDGGIETSEYDKSNKVTRQTSAEGIVTVFEYDTNARRTAARIMNGGSPLYSWQTQYNNAGLATKSIAPDATETTYAYDKNQRRTKQTNPDGRVTEWVYDQLGRVLTTRLGDGGGTSIMSTMVYDKLGNVLTSTDALGRATIHVYDGFGRRVTTTDPTGAYSVMAYDNASRITMQKRHASGGTLLTHSTTEYDALGRTTLQRQKAAPGGGDGDDDALTTMGYDGEDRNIHRITWTTDAAAITTTYDYDGAGRQTSMADGDSLVTTYEYDADGHRTKVIDPRGNSTTYAYDLDGRQTLSTNMLGDYTETDYDQRGLQTEMRQYGSGAVLLAKTKYSYDTVGRQTLVRKKAAPGGGDNDAIDHVVRSFFDTGGKLTKSTSASGYDTTYAYDSFGRQTRTTQPDGSYNTSDYTLGGTLTKQVRYELIGGNTRSFRTDHLIDSNNRVTQTVNQGPDGTFGNGDDLDVQYVYDGAGRQVTLINESDRLTLSEYDALNRKTRVTEDAAGVARVTDFAFDRAGRLSTLTAYNNGTSGPQETVYAYNGRGLQTLVTYEETGTVTQAYDSAGNMTKRTDEEAVAVDYLYDNANRLTERLKNGGSVNIEKYIYDGLGRLLTARKGTSGSPDAVSRSIFAYDALSRVTGESQSIAGGGDKAVGYGFDKAGNRLTLLHHGGGVTATYAYDTRDRCTAVGHNGATLADYSWLGSAMASRDTTCDYPGGTKPKFRAEFQRDGLLRVTHLATTHQTLDQATSGYNDLGTWDYNYDASSNELTMAQAGSPGFLEASAEHSYDTADRLITTQNWDTQVWSGPHAPGETTWYTYDDLGNRISHVHRDAGAIGYGHDKANRMTTLAGLSQGYDDAGNLTLAYSADRGTSYTYRYDHHNRLTGVYDSTNTTRKAAFSWDALGRRVEYADDVTGVTNRFYFDGVNELVEDNPGGTRQRYYVHGVSYVDERLMMYNDDHQRPYYYTVDRMYNVRSIVDRAGAIVERYAYDGYGRPYIRESAGRGDMNNDTLIEPAADGDRFRDARSGTIWDPRADIDDDGDVDGSEGTLFDAKQWVWDVAHPLVPGPTVSQAFSDVDNRYAFQGVPSFVMDTAANATAANAKLTLGHHRARLVDVMTGRWNTRDPLTYLVRLLPLDVNIAMRQLIPRVDNTLPTTFASHFQMLNSNPNRWLDAFGLKIDSTSDTEGLTDLFGGCCTFSSNLSGFTEMDCGPCCFAGFADHIRKLQEIIESETVYVIHNPVTEYHACLPTGQCIDMPVFDHNLGISVAPNTSNGAELISSDGNFHVYITTNSQDDEVTLVHELIGHGHPPPGGTFDEAHSANEVDQDYRDARQQCQNAGLCP